MDWSLILNILFGSVTVASVVIAVRENQAKARAREAEARAKEMYRSHCETRCRFIVGTTRDLSESSHNACRLVRTCSMDSDVSRSGPRCEHVAPLTGLVYSIRTATNQLITFCRTLNDEYQNEFGRPIVENFEKEIPLRICGDENEDCGSRGKQREGRC